MASTLSPNQAPNQTQSLDKHNSTMKQIDNMVFPKSIRTELLVKIPLCLTTWKHLKYWAKTTSGIPQQTLEHVLHFQKLHFPHLHQQFTRLPTDSVGHKYFCRAGNYSRNAVREAQELIALLQFQKPDFVGNDVDQYLESTIFAPDSTHKQKLFAHALENINRYQLITPPTVGEGSTCENPTRMLALVLAENCDSVGDVLAGVRMLGNLKGRSCESSLLYYSDVDAKLATLRVVELEEERKQRLN